MHKRIIRLWALLAIWVGLAACSENIVFEENHQINHKGWEVDEILVFEHELKDTLGLHDIFLNVRNNTDYPYSNLYVFFQTRFPDGRVFRDTVEMMLADKQGKWTGKGFGRIKSNSFHFRKDVWFPIEGVYEFSIQHAMREEVLEGITDMGLRLERK